MRPLFILITVFILCSSAVGSQDLVSILDIHYEAAAAEKMDKVGTIITRGKNIQSMTGYESPFTVYQSRPNKIRIEAEIQGSQTVQTFNGKEGWMYAPVMGISEPKEMKDNELESLIAQAEFEDPLWKYAERGNRLELAGESEEGNTYQIRLINGEGEMLDYFIDRDSHMISSFKTIQVMGGSETEVEVFQEDYKEVSGIPLAHKHITKMDGQVVSTVLIDRIEINGRIDTALFERPVSE